MFPNSRGWAGAPRPRYGKELRRPMRIFLQTAASEAEFDFEKTSTPARNKASLPLGEAVCLAAISDTGSLAAAGSGEEVVPPARPHHLPQSHKRIDRIDTACRR